MLTECSYDYVFVYDGNTYNSPLLGSFSGETIPDVLVASSQYVSMLSTTTTGYYCNCCLHYYCYDECLYTCMIFYLSHCYSIAWDRL